MDPRAPIPDAVVNATAMAAPEPPSSSLFRSGLHTLATNLVSVLLSFLISVLVARALGPEGKGSYDLIIATAMLLSTILGLSLPAGVTYVVARDRPGLSVLLRGLLAFALTQIVIAAGVLFILRETSYAATFLPTGVGEWVPFAVVTYLLFTTISGYLRAILAGRQDFISLNQRELLGRIFHVIALALVAGFTIASGKHQAVSALVWTSIAASAILSLLLFRTLPKPGSNLGQRVKFREIFSYALPCYLGNTAQFLNYRVDIFFVSAFAGAGAGSASSRGAVGLYLLAVTLAQLIWMISNSAATVLLPRIAAVQQAGGDHARHTARIIRLAVWVSLIAALVMAFAAELLLTRIYGAEFQQSLAPLRWLLPGIVIFSMTNVAASYLAGIGKPRLNLIGSVAGLFFTIVLDLALIPRLQISGAAIASTASYSVSTVVILWFFLKESGLRARDLVALKSQDLEWLTSQLRSMSKSSIVANRPGR